MLDSDDVLLLQPARPDTALAAVTSRTAAAHRNGDPGLLLATTCLLTKPAEETGVVDATVTALRDLSAAEDRRLLAVLVTAAIPNRFPALPVREGEHALVWLESCRPPRSAEAALAARRARAGWRDGVPDSLADHLREPALVSRLLPTARSLLTP
jgi:hypothetical protein